VRELYPELLKRLDDSNDSVRRAVCATLAAFFRATPPENVKGIVLDYSSDQLLVHLDDQDPAVQVCYLPLVIYRWPNCLPFVTLYTEILVL
jgi:HEAT repeat